MNELFVKKVQSKYLKQYRGAYQNNLQVKGEF